MPAGPAVDPAACIGTIVSDSDQPGDPGSSNASRPHKRTNDAGQSSEATRTAAPAASSLPLAGSTWGDLRIVAEIGAGAYGRVYRAWDAGLAREVALKIIRLERPDSRSVDAVLREGQMLARIRHPHVVTIYGARQIGREIGLWMELVRGRPLAQMIREDGPMGPEEAAVAGIRLCDALAAVHAEGLLHRDIKAQNVMRESGGRIVLMDFGAGRELLVGRAGWSDMAGTPVYMAPEVLAGGTWSTAADVYSLGVLLYFLVTGRYPVEGRTLTDIALAHGLGQHRLLADCRPGLPEGFVRVVEHALASRPELRHRSAGAMMHDLAEAIPGSSGSWRDRLAPHLQPGIDSALHDPTTGSSARARRTAHWGVVLGGTLLGIWMLGFVTSMAFNQALGRTQFSDESGVSWLVWGLRSLIGPALFMTLAYVMYRLVRLLWRICERLVPPLARASWRVQERLTTVLRSRGLLDRTTGAQWLLGAQAVAVAAACWIFRDLIAAFASFLDTAPPGALAQLSPDNDAQVVYRAVLSILFLGLAAIWYRLLHAPSGGLRVDRAVAAGGLALLGLLLVILSAPFRLVYQNQFQRADYKGERCYITGQRGTDLLLFCPDVVPRNRIVGAADSDLHRTPVVESIFTSAPAPAR